MMAGFGNNTECACDINFPSLDLPPNYYDLSYRDMRQKKPDHFCSASTVSCANFYLFEMRQNNNNIQADEPILYPDGTRRPVMTASSIGGAWFHDQTRRPPPFPADNTAGSQP